MNSRRSDVQCRATIFGVPSMLSTSVKFADDLELDWRAYELRRSGQPIRLSRIPMELLFLSVERRGELVPRDEIVARIWGKDVFWIRTTASTPRCANFVRYWAMVRNTRDTCKPSAEWVIASSLPWWKSARRKLVLPRRRSSSRSRKSGGKKVSTAGFCRF
jgi:hypothetical protein